MKERKKQIHPGKGKQNKYSVGDKDGRIQNQVEGYKNTQTHKDAVTETHVKRERLPGRGC